MIRVTNFPINKRDHIKRVHLRPHLCDRSGNISEAGTPNQNLEAVGYMRTNGSNSQDMNSGEEVSGLGLESAETWQEIYMFLFPQRIPNKCKTRGLVPDIRYETAIY